ncbi:winged helix-turn-helix domain-containing protein [Catellatospora methionotrophica]|uniref:winged helix-turn-helix domain-containing protein n=1 Tax=Catellatospora methionotrophica TaxID=121620 RepID=UPI00140A626F|nr:winged helix-turn-helix domain-containing protein [Catellatospora methionotrophica]
MSELRAVSDTVRLAVLTILFDHPQETFSVRDLAERTGVALTLMHYHLKILRTEDLVGVVVRRTAQGRRERRYQTSCAALRWDFPAADRPAT